MSKKVLFLILSQCNGGYGGIAEYNRNLLRALNQNGSYRIHVFVRKGNNYRICGENYIHYKPIFNKYLFSSFVIYKAIVLKPQIIFNGHLLTLPLSSILLKLTNAKGVSQFHGTEIWDKELRKKQKIQLKKFQCFCVSNFTKNNLKQINGINSNVVPNTYNPHFKYLDDRRRLRKKFNLDKKDIVLITVGRLDSRKNGYKGQEYVIDFINKQKEISDHNYKYFIIGKGELKDRLENKIINLNLQNDVFLLGYVKDNDLIEYYNCSDVFVLLSSGEGFGIVYLEAMACGLPAIGLNIGGVSDVLKYNFTKRIDDITSLKSALEGLSIYSNSKKNVISKKVEDDFGFSKFYTCLIEEFNKL